MKGFKNIAPSELLDYIDRQMEINNKKQYEILRELALDSRYIGKIRYKLGRQLKTKTSTLQERRHFCIQVNVGIKSVKEVAEITGYTSTTIRQWVRDYNKYGDEMLHLATGFNHYKG